MPNTVIVGANRGIGLELVRQHVDRGDSVVALCRSASPALEATGAWVETGIDVTDGDALHSLPQRLGGLAIDRLLVVAGVLAQESLDALDSDAARRIVRQFEVNALAPLRVVAAVQQKLAPGAKVGILTSRMGSIADNGSGGYYGYRMSKAAVNAAGRSLAIDLKPRGVAVFLLHPGFVRTDMTGGRGDIGADQSAANLIARLDALGIEDSGSFWHANGERLPW